MSKNSYHFEVDKIVEYLKKFKSSAESYKWSFRTRKLLELNFLSKTQIEKLENGKTPYIKEIILKELLYKKLKDLEFKNSEQFLNLCLCLWIIEDWGGINGAKSESTKELIKKNLKQEKKQFNRIASSSKVASFFNPKEFIIYDSRVAYSLNWIILSENAGNYFFPIPDGRNSKMAAFEMDTLIKMKNIEKYKTINLTDLENKKFISNKSKDHYIPKREAYFELNKLIKEINNKLWNDNKKSFLYYTEMILFCIADREIYNDITNRVNLVIN